MAGPKLPIRYLSSLPLKVFQVEPFCAAAEPSESNSRSRAEPRTEQARLLLPIADGHLHEHRRRRRQQLQKLKLQERPAPGEKGEEEEEQCASGGRVGFLRPRERQINGKTGAGDAMMLLSCVPCVIGEEEEKVASGSGEPGKGEGGQRIPGSSGDPCHLRFSDEAIKRFACGLGPDPVMIAHLIIIRRRADETRGVGASRAARAVTYASTLRDMVAARRVASRRVPANLWTRGTHPLCSALFSARPAMRSAMDDDAVGRGLGEPSRAGTGSLPGSHPCVLARTSAQPERSRGTVTASLKMVAVVALNGAVTLALPAWLLPAPQQDDNGSSMPPFTIFS
nr:unnamed protein product [Digitaria exilis]